MSTTAFIKPSTPISLVSNIGSKNTTAIQSGPYTKAQFQSTMEGSRTVKDMKEVEHLLRDYPAALEFYRTGKYKVKVKYEANVERIILVEKRTTKGILSNNSTTTTTNNIQQDNQTVPGLFTNEEKGKEEEEKEEKEEEVRKEQDFRQSRSRTSSQDRIAPTISGTNGNNLVHTTISSIRMTSNTQPKVDHYRTSPNEREDSVTSQLKQHAHHHNHSRDNQHKASYNKQQEKQIHKEYPTMMAPLVSNVTTPGNLWQQQHQQQALHPYFSNPLLQQQRSNIHIPSRVVPQQNPAYRQPYFHGQRPTTPLAYQQQSVYPTPSTVTMGNSNLHLAYNYPSSIRSVFSTTHSIGVPTSFRTFHPNQQQQVRLSHPIYQSQVPLPINYPWVTTTNGPSNTVGNNNKVNAEQRRGAKHRAHSVDISSRKNPLVCSTNFQQQSGAVGDQHHHYHHHRPHPINVPTNNIGPSIENRKDLNVSLKEPTNVGNSGTNSERLTIRQLNETFMQTDSSGRLPYSSLPALLQRFGMTLTENDLVSAARHLEYDINEPISARRLIYVLVKLGKIKKSTHQQRQLISPSMLPEDREVTDILKQRKEMSTHIHSSNQTNQWY